jgi:hypothetical protein
VVHILHTPGFPIPQDLGASNFHLTADLPALLRPVSRHDLARQSGQCIDLNHNPTSVPPSTLANINYFERRELDDLPQKIAQEQLLERISKAEFL